MFNFIWDSPIDKIKRNVSKQTYEKGGLKVLDINNHIISLKSTWIRRYLTGSGKWKTIFEENFNVNLLFNVGNKYIEICSNKTKNIFWRDTFNSWKKCNR